MPTAVPTLLVDDEPDLRLLLRLEIERRNHGLSVCGEAGDGAAAIAAAQETDPAVVVLDYRMPGMNGLETALRIRELRPEQVIVLLTAFLDPQLQAEAEEAGIDACLDKRSVKELPDLLFSLSA